MKMRKLMRIIKIKVNSNGELVATAGRDPTVRVWQASTGQRVKKVSCGSVVSSLVWRDNENIIYGCRDGKIQQWLVDKEHTTSTRSTRTDLEGHSDAVYSIDYQPSSSLLATRCSSLPISYHRMTLTLQNR